MGFGNTRKDFRSYLVKIFCWPNQFVVATKSTMQIAGEYRPALCYVLSHPTAYRPALISSKLVRLSFFSGEARRCFILLGLDLKSRMEWV